MKKKTTILTLFIPLILFSETLSLEENLSLKIEELTTVKQGKKLLKKLKADFIKKNISTYEKAIAKGWKNIYPISAKESKYQKFLGRSIKYDGQLYEKLENVLIDNGRIFYIFKRIFQPKPQVNPTKRASPKKKVVIS
jgi:hypothetical protein